jgi:hypothetical protein
MNFLLRLNMDDKNICSNASKTPGPHQAHITQANQKQMIFMFCDISTVF